MSIKEYSVNAIPFIPSEEKYLNIQKECGELHALIQQTQIDHQTAIEQWEGQQEELENKIHDLERRLELSGEEVENVHTILVADREKAQQIIRAIKNEMTNRGERYFILSKYFFIFYFIFYYSKHFLLC